MNSIITDFKINEAKVLEIFRKYGVITEKPIDINEFIKEIDSCIYNRVSYASDVKVVA